MRIESVQIQGYRCLEDVNVSFEEVTTFIGPNGAGKSTVLRALDWFFNGSETLEDEDVTYGRGIDEISVRVTFVGLTDRDRDALGRYAPPGSDTFTVWKRRAPGGHTVMSANVRAYPAFSDIRRLQGALERRMAFNAMADELGVEKAVNAETLDAGMIAWEMAHLDQLQDAPVDLTTSFFGFNGANQLSGIFDFVLVTADLRASEQVADGRNTIVGRILERSVDRTSAEDRLEELRVETEARQQAIFQESFGPQLVQLSRDLTAAVEQYSTGKAIEVAQTPITTPVARTHFEVAVAEAEFRTTVERQGHGFQRTLLIAALQLLAHQGAAAADQGAICLAIEEPELFQHPVQAQAFATVLRKLAEDPDQGIQVCYATHSPHFITAGKFSQVRRLTRPHRAQGPGSTVVASCTVDAAIERLSGLRSEEHVRKALDSMATHRLPEAFFAQAVLLVEGTTDRAVFEGIGDRHDEEPLAVAGVVVSDVGGKDAMLLPLAVLDELAIPYFVLFDGDAGLLERGRREGKAEAQLAVTVAAARKGNRGLLQYLGQEPVDQPETGVHTRFAVVEDSLEVLLADWGEWGVELQRIEDEEGISVRKNHVAYRYATARAEGEPPPFIGAVMNAVRLLA
ncbi:AAA family ATPase [Nocardioides soli]|uniref:Putative ATP-dependent endonuclease of OLD family n=1 Tax=Nocardioides soli TaxID=1036020 RepID=A0A7W4VTZ7_9ACTN|nr:putative ATP-dependent endonuclease of OLD family [Nocardioides soli]